MLVLDVDWDQFSTEVSRRLPGQQIYLSEVGPCVMATAAATDGSLVVRSRNNTSLEKARTEFESKGAKIARGKWSTGIEDADDAPEMPHIAAVAYQSSENKPGVWIDAFPNEPSVQEVLTGLFEEFRENGEIHEVGFEDFLRLATPNVAILTPDEIRYHMTRKIDDVE